MTRENQAYMTSDRALLAEEVLSADEVHARQQGTHTSRPDDDCYIHVNVGYLCLGYAPDIVSKHLRVESRGDLTYR